MTHRPEFSGWQAEEVSSEYEAETVAIQLVGSDGSSEQEEANIVDAHFPTVLRVHSRRELLTGLAKLDIVGIPAVAILDLEVMGGIGAAFDTLRGIRETFPEIQVLLVSSASARNEFGRHRLPICDITLAKHFDENDLALGLIAASRNNAEWCRRRAEMASDNGVIQSAAGDTSGSRERGPALARPVEVA